MIPDSSLVREARAGRREAYETLVRRWSARVLALCRARTGCRDVAEELAQECFLRGFAALHSLEDPGKFGAWLSGIATRLSFDWIRSRRRSQKTFSDLGDDWRPEENLAESAPAEGARLEEEEEAAQLRAAVDDLPEKYRTVLMLFYYGEHSYREIADALGISRAAVNARLTQGRALLRRRLGAACR